LIIWTSILFTSRDSHHSQRDSARPTHLITTNSTQLDLPVSSRPQLTKIEQLVNPEQVKAKRAVRKGKITRLRHQLDDVLKLDLQKLEAGNLEKIIEDLRREKSLFEALQERFEGLMAEQDDSTQEGMEREMIAGEEIKEQCSYTLRQAKKLKHTHSLYVEASLLERNFNLIMSKPEAPYEEIEKNSSKLQKRISAFLSQTTSNPSPLLADCIQNVIDQQAQLYTLVTDSRAKSIERLEAKTPSVSTPAPFKFPKSTSLKLDLPTFSGNPTEWHNFFDLFSSTLARAGEEFSDRERTCFLLKAMANTTAEEIVKNHATADDGYSKAVEALTQKFGVPKVVLPHLVRKVTAKETFTFSQESLSRLRKNHLLPIAEMKRLGCDSAKHLVAALILDNFDAGLYENWSKHYRDEERAPTTDDIDRFIRPLESNVRDEPASVKTQPARKQTQNTQSAQSSSGTIRENDRNT